MFGAYFQIFNEEVQKLHSVTFFLLSVGRKDVAGATKLCMSMNFSNEVNVAMALDGILGAYNTCKVICSPFRLLVKIAGVS